MTTDKEKTRLVVGQDGQLLEKKQVDVAKLDALQKIDGTPQRDRIILQPLAAAEVKMASGIILPEATSELRCAVLAVSESSSYKRGDVVLLKRTDFPIDPKDRHSLPGEMCEGNLVLFVYESFIWHKYAYRIED